METLNGLAMLLALVNCGMAVKDVYSGKVGAAFVSCAIALLLVA